MSESLHEKAKGLAARPYTLKIMRDDSVPNEPLYLALNPELEGCMAQGATIEEAEDNLAEFRIDYIQHLLEHSLPIPYPASMATITGVTFKGSTQKIPSFGEAQEQVVQPSGLSQFVQ